jgi:hypothetical protein
MYPPLEVDMTSEFNNTAMLSSCLHVSEKFPRTFVWQSIAYALARCSSWNPYRITRVVASPPPGIFLANQSFIISVCVSHALKQLAWGLMFYSNIFYACIIHHLSCYFLSIFILILPLLTSRSSLYL